MSCDTFLLFINNYYVNIYLFFGVMVMNAKEYEKSINLVSTRSIERIDDILYTGFDSSLADISYNNCINVFNYIKEFCDMYQSFISDYKKLIPISVLDNYRMSIYYETPHFKSLRYKNEDSILYFMSLNNMIKLIKESTNNIENRINMNISPSIVIDYLNFGKKYQDLLERYNVIVDKLRSLNINNDVVISVRFDSDDITKLQYVELSFGIYNTNFKLIYLLNKDFSLYSVSNASSYKFNEEEIERIAKSIYIDRTFVYGLKAFEDNKSLIRKNTIL